MQKINVLFCFVFFFSLSLQAQDVNLEIGSTTIDLNETFEIKVTSDGVQIREHDKFPEIPGMYKATLSAFQETRVINGKVMSQYSLTQFYSPTKEGEFFLRPFTMRVNGEELRHKGSSIQVKKGNASSSPGSIDPTDYWKNAYKNDDNTAYKNVKADAFFAITTSKEEVYVGEGFGFSIAFYVANTNQAEMQFYELDTQLKDILKEAKPKNCWEEEFRIYQPQRQQVTINGKKYTEYRIYHSVFYPLSEDDIEIPSVPFGIMKFQTPKNASAFRPLRGKGSVEMYESKPLRIKVKPLPPHPKAKNIPVGEYRLVEKLPNRQVQTGEPFQYQFQIEGEGNITAIPAIEIIKSNNFDFYPPEVNTDVRRNDDKIYGRKIFNYIVSAREPGTYPWGSYFQMIYFNPKEGKYDTLRSAYDVFVSGESMQNKSISSIDLGDFYTHEHREASNKLRPRGAPNLERWFVNIALILLLIAAPICLFWYRKKQQEEQAS
ncbi:MAG: BatD family protein [Bernardetiaceae bacterium]|nr:BatD family protein [Bernardetiaceae bacterium]